MAETAIVLIVNASSRNGRFFTLLHFREKILLKSWTLIASSKNAHCPHSLP